MSLILKTTSMDFSSNQNMFLCKEKLHVTTVELGSNDNFRSLLKLSL